MQIEKLGVGWNNEFLDSETLCGGTAHNLQATVSEIGNTINVNLDELRSI